jgi:RNA polymerase sigma-B factor
MCTPWARREAARYRHGAESRDDLEQVALVGLILAVDRYDPDRETPFRYFALPTIGGEIKRYFRDRGWSVRVSRRVQELCLEVRQAEPELTQLLGRAPTDRDLAKHLNLREEHVQQAREGARLYRSHSLNRPCADDASTELGDTLGHNDPAIDRIADHDALRRALHVLPERLRMLLSLRYLDELTQCQIADKMGISQMHVSRLLARALSTLREHMAAESPTLPEGPGGT